MKILFAISSINLRGGIASYANNLFNTYNDEHEFVFYLMIY